MLYLLRRGNERYHDNPKEALTISWSKTFPSLVSFMSPAPDTNLRGGQSDKLYGEILQFTTFS